MRTLTLNLTTILIALATTCAFADPPAPPSPQSALLELLRSDAPVEQKSDACRQLERVATKDAVPALAALLSHDQLSHKARMALEHINDPSVDDALRDAAGKLQGRLLIGVLQSIGHRRDTRSTDLLTRFLKNTDPEIASTAAYALGLIGSPDSAKTLEQELPAASDQLKPAILDALLRAAESFASANQRDAAIALYDRLRASDAPAHIQAAAARGAVVARQADGIKLLPELLADRRWAIFNVALRLTIELRERDASVTQTVAAQLARLPAERQSLGIQALANRADKSALPEIRTFLKSDNATLRTAAIRAAAQMEDKASLPAFLDAATAQDKSLAEAAIAALIRLTGPEVDTALLEWVNGADAARSLIAIDCLARRQSTSAASALLKATASADVNVRLASIKALADIGTPAELKPVLDLLLKSPAGPEKDAAGQTVLAICAAVSDKSACEKTLLDTLSSTTAPEQKVIILRIVGTLPTDKSLQALRAASRDADDNVQETAVRALCNWPTADAAPDLIALAKDAPKPAHRLLALRNWLRLAADKRLPADKCFEMCEQALPLIQRTEEKRQLLAALSAIPTQKSFARIAPFLDDQTVREEACTAAVTVADPLIATPPANFDPAPISQAIQKVKQISKHPRTLQLANAILARLKQK